MKVLLVSHSSADAGGAELSLHELVEGLTTRLGFQVHVVLPSAGPLLARLQGLGVETSVERHIRGWVCGPSSVRGRARHAAAHALGVLRLVHLIRRARPDVVVTNTLVIPGAAVAARSLRIPHVWYVHEFGSKDHGFSFDLGLERSLRIVGRLSDRVIVNSRAVLVEMSRRMGPDKLRLLYYAVVVPARAAKPKEEQREGWNVVLVGTKAPQKGQEDAIRAVAVLRDAGQRVTLRLVGGGDPAHVLTLEALARALGIAESVEFVPATRDVFAHLEWAHIALVCSRAEAFGRVTVEAMKMGRPVIGARREGTAELIRDGWNGLLYEPGDAAELASKIRFLGENPRVAGRLAERAQAWAAEEFTIERYVGGFASVLEDVSAGRRQPSPALPPAAR